MELQAIIGARKGKIGKLDVYAICNQFILDEEVSPKNRSDIILETNVDKVRDFSISQSTIPVLLSHKARNLYVKIPGIIDPQKLFHNLYNQGFIVRDSKLTQTTK